MVDQEIFQSCEQCLSNADDVRRGKRKSSRSDGLGEIHILLFGDFKTAIYQKYAW